MAEPRKSKRVVLASSNKDTLMEHVDVIYPGLELKQRSIPQVSTKGRSNLEAKVQATIWES